MLTILTIVTDITWFSKQDQNLSMQSSMSLYANFTKISLTELLTNKIFVKLGKIVKLR